METIPCKIDQRYPHFGLVSEPTPHKQHPNEQNGLDLYVEVYNLDTGERCWKKLYENSKGLHFKHTGYSPMYVSDFQQPAEIIPFQWRVVDLERSEG